MYHHITNLTRLGFNPDLVIDVGALFGHWTEQVITIFPETAFIMVESQTDKKQYLEAVTRKFNNVNAQFSLVDDVEKMGWIFMKWEAGQVFMKKIPSVIGKRYR
jgi:hypothetical protein